jgi:predicted transcriptional regulator
MSPQTAYRDRDAVEVAVLDALLVRNGEGMTVFELRSRVDADIDELEAALARLDEDGLIIVEADGDRTRIFPHDSVKPPDDEADRSLFDYIRDRLSL